MTNSTIEPWQLDKEWASQYFPAIRKVIHGLAKDIIEIEIAPEQEDNEHATDYIVRLKTGQIACRIRRPECSFRDITLRSWRASGARTELDKIKEGFARWYLYAWAQDSESFADWIFLDLEKLRASDLLTRERSPIDNKDGCSGFIALAITELQQNHCILASSMLGVKPQ